MEGNRIGKALEVLGEKIIALESEVKYERYLKEEAQKKCTEKDEYIAELEKTLNKIQAYVDDVEGEVSNEV